MKDKNIEQRMRNVMNEQTVIPPAFVWENIEETLHPKASKKSFFIWFFGLSILFATIMVGYSYINKSSNMNAQQTVSEASIVESQKEELMTKASIHDISATNTLNEELTKVTKTDGILKENSTQEAQNTVPQTSKNNAEHILIKGQSQAPIFTDKDPFITTADNQKEIKFEALNSLKIIGNEPLRMESKNRLTLGKLEQINRLSAATFTIDPFILKDDVVCPSFNNKKKLSPFVTLSAFGGRHSKSLNDGSNAVLASLRKNTESTWYTWGFTGTAGLNFNANTYAGIGVDWTQIKEKFHDESEILTKMIITFDPISGAPIDTSIVTGQLVNKGEIRYTAIDIPLFFGITRSLNQWSFGVEAGPYLNLSFAAKGKIYNESLNLSRVEEESAIYKNKLGLGIKASLVARRNFENGFSIELKPTFKSYLSNINVDNYPLPTKLSGWGINIGLRKDF